MMEDERLQMIKIITINGFRSSQGRKEAVISSIDHLLASLIQFDGRKPNIFSSQRCSSLDGISMVFNSFL